MAIKERATRYKRYEVTCNDKKEYFYAKYNLFDFLKKMLADIDVGDTLNFSVKFRTYKEATGEKTEELNLGYGEIKNGKA